MPRAAHGDRGDPARAARSGRRRDLDRHLDGPLLAVVQLGHHDRLGRHDAGPVHADLDLASRIADHARAVVDQGDPDYLEWPGGRAGEQVRRDNLSDPHASWWHDPTS